MINGGKIKKTIIFTILDIIIVFLFTLFWFKTIDNNEKALSESIEYTFFVTLLFSLYYYVFDLCWGYFDGSSLTV